MTPKFRSKLVRLLYEILYRTSRASPMARNFIHKTHLWIVPGTRTNDENSCDDSEYDKIYAVTQIQTIAMVDSSLAKRAHNSKSDERDHENRRIHYVAGCCPWFLCPHGRTQAPPTPSASSRPDRTGDQYGEVKINLVFHR
jgi:hypothetical protein